MRVLPLMCAALVLLAAGCGSTGGGEASATVPSRAATIPPPVPGVTGPTLAAAGDIACPRGLRHSSFQCRQADTAAVVRRLHADVVAPLGDLQYDRGSVSDWRTGSFRTTWGAFRSIMRPAVGNHEYATGSTDGYWGYFHSRAGPRGKYWYSYELGTWHVVVLNGNCTIIGCGPGSAQGRWLRADLAAHPTQCTLAYWHQPLFSSGLHGNNPPVKPLWQALERAGADVVLNGHDHIYERFAPQTSTGRASSSGITEFVVGTGGRVNYPIIRVKPNSRVRRSFAFGAIELTLGDGAYSWRFAPVAGMTFTDRGSARCH